MRYLRVKNWEKLQHSSEKPLPWIKFFTALLAPTKEPCYSEWPDSTKALLHHIWLMARVFNNKIPESWLTKEKLNLKSRVILDPLIESGFIWFESEDGVRLPLSRARVARSELSNLDSLSPGDTGGYSPKEEFERFWDLLLETRIPQPVNKKASEKHWIASVKSAMDVAAVWEARERYAAQVDPKFVQYAATWLNNWRDWVEYRPPQVKKSDSNGHDDDARAIFDRLENEMYGQPEWEAYKAYVAQECERDVYAAKPFEEWRKTR